MSEPPIPSCKVAKWGNSAAVRLPVRALERAGLAVGDAVEVVAREDAILLRRRRPRVALDELLARFDPAKHRGDPLLDDAPTGTETG
ncbi:MAG: AbrB/MazE/SpoVT family DNA-binding domain-containing protein [Alphaproteobacteria bacterium]|nr:AbrB/MazE/SpoVT family DNA-binding domain-containing protein [Alphaproteobacteria bacterium]